MKLRTKTFVFVLPLGLLCGFVAMRMSGDAVRSVINEDIAKRGVSVIQELAPSLQRGLRKKNEPELLPRLQAFAQRSDALYAGILDENGKIIAHTNVAEVGKRPDDAFGAECLAARTPIFRQSESRGEPVMDLAVPLWLEEDEGTSGETFLFTEGASGKQRIGTLRTGLRLREHLRMQETLSSRLFGILSLTLLLTFALLLLLTELALRPIHLLTRATEQVRKGNYDVIVPVRSSDELGILAGSFNSMSGELSATTVSRDYLNSMFSGIADMLITTELDGRVRTANLAACEALGRTEKDLRGAGVFELFEDAGEASAKLSGVLNITGGELAASASGFLAGLELPLRGTGAPIPALLSVSILRDRSGSPDGLVFVAKDLTERNKVDEKIRKSEERFQQVADSTQVWIWETDADGLYTYSNSVVETVLGYKPEEIVGRMHFYDFFTPDTKEALTRTALEGFKKKQPFISFINQNIHKDGSVVLLETSGTPVLDKAGELTGYLGSDTDITERKRLEESLVQAEKMSAIGQLAAGVAHEINNPLGVILGFAQSAAKRIKDGDVLALPLKTIEREAVRCRNLVRNLLVFSRASSSEQREKVDVNSALEGALSLILAQARTCKVELVRELGSGLPVISANHTQLQQIVINLASNGIDAMPGGGTLTVRTSLAARPPARVEIMIRDTGVGIPAAIRTRIFEPFFTSKDVGKGTGLGLPLVYEIVHKHGGVMELESEEGKGTTFTVLLPAAPAGDENAARR